MHPAAVVVDDDVAGVAVAGQVDLGHRSRVDRVHPGAGRRHRIDTVVQCVDHQVVDVQQQAAAAAPGQGVEELGFGEVCVGPVQVGREVFDQDAALQPVLHLLHLRHQDLERGAGEGQRQQIVGMQHQATGLPRRTREGRMVADPDRVDALGQPRQPVQVPRVQPGRRAQRQPHAMQADRVVPAHLVQQRQRRAAVGKEVLGVHLHKAQSRQVMQQGLVVRLAQADAHAGVWQGRQRRHGGARPHLAIATLASCSVLPFKALQVPAAT